MSLQIDSSNMIDVKYVQSRAVLVMWYPPPPDYVEWTKSFVLTAVNYFGLKKRIEYYLKK